MPDDDSKRMVDEEFELVFSQLGNFASLIATIDVEGFIDRCKLVVSERRADDPAQYRRAVEKMLAYKELAQGALRFKQAALRFRNEMARLDAEEKARNRGF